MAEQIKLISPTHVKHLSHPKYRADIDGLRAIAVLSVVGFHAFPKVIKGGFIGVDVFFVISGFLISAIIFSSLERNAFSFTEFYGKRIRRIFPSLLVVLTSCFVFGWFALLADEYKQLGKHIAGGAGFISNFILWNESGYFDNVAETKPLLHLWSLGVEEQFYVIWPLLLWFAWKQRLNLLTIAITVGVMSFVLNVSKVPTDSAAAFYSPQTRFWELMVGSVLAYMTLHRQSIFPKLKHLFDTRLVKIICVHAPEENCKTLRNVQSVLGATLIIVGVLTINKERLFPGWWAALPTLGTVLIIKAGMHAWLNRVVLSNRVLVWFGLISFPLYLWHWPVLSFARIVESETPSLKIRVAAVLISIVFAWLTYSWIEKPLRFGKHNNIKIAALSLMMVVVGYMGYNTYKRDGLLFRKNAAPTALFEGDIGHIAFHKYPFSKFYLCTPGAIATTALQWNGYVRCLQSQNNENVDIALVGDSHAEHLFIGLAEQLPNKNIVFYIKAGTPFIENSDFADIYKHVLSSKTIKKVILTMYWAGKYSQVPAGRTLESEILHTADELIRSGKDVYITDDIPGFPFDPEKCRDKRVFSSTQRCTIDKADFAKASAEYLPKLNNIIRQDPRIKLIVTSKYFCDDKYCSMTMGNKLLYRDNNHLNINGSKYLGQKIVQDYQFF